LVSVLAIVARAVLGIGAGIGCIQTLPESEMIYTRITSIIIVVILLIPIGKIFFDMAVYKNNEEPLPQKLDDNWEIGQPFEHSAAMKAIQTFHTISPFDFSLHFLQFGPRKVLGFIGLAATALIFTILVYCAVRPTPGHSATYEWIPDDTLPNGEVSIDSERIIDWKDYESDEPPKG